MHRAILSVTLVLAAAQASAPTDARSVASVSATSRQAGCVLVGNLRAPAQLRVYVEQKDNTKGSSLWNGTIARDQRVSISSPTDRIIYDYRYDDRDTWKENNHTWCHNNADEKVP